MGAKILGARSPGRQFAQATELCTVDCSYLSVLGIVPASCRHSVAQEFGGCPNFCEIFVDSCVSIYILVNFKYFLTVRTENLIPTEKTDNIVPVRLV